MHTSSNNPLASVYGRRRRFAYLALLVAPVALIALPAFAQNNGARTDSAARPQSSHFWRDFAAGAVTSILVHEGGHIGTSLAYGKRITFGFDKGRPTVYSGIDATYFPHQQFVFSSMGLNAQAALDEVILDAPHRRGAAFERGVLAGGIGTALFYVTLGRSGSVSDVDYMSRTSSLSKDQISLIYGSIAALHVFRIRRDGHYANFFARPSADGTGRIKLGLDVSPE
jgi:hypothetical protein